MVEFRMFNYRLTQRVNGRSRLLLLSLIASIFTVMAGAAASGYTSAVAGDVTGTITLLNAKDSDPSDVAVWLEPVSGKARKSPSGEKNPAIRQKGKRMIPQVLITTVGQEVDFPNEDPFVHNIFSNSEVKRFDLGIYQEGETRSVLFTRPGVISVHCNIHPQMEAFVVVVNSPYYDLSNKKGEFQIKNVPAGKYRFRVWHRRANPELLKALTRPVTVEVGGSLGNIQIDEAGYVYKRHKNKEGRDYN
jgi:plastocyanin